MPVYGLTSGENATLGLLRVAVRTPAALFRRIPVLRAFLQIKELSWLS